MISIVIVEDELDIGDLLALYCRQQDWNVVQTASGEKALELIRGKQPDFVLLDIGLAGDMDGLEVCSELRKFSDVPVLLLTARDDEVDRILGLELGADDYVTKPFSPREVIARIKAVLRRENGSHSPKTLTVEVFGEISIDKERKQVSRSEVVIDLASQEINLLEVFLENQGQVLSRQQLLDLAWGPDWIGDPRTVDVHVRQLRKKLGKDLPLETVRGHGYRFN